MPSDLRISLATETEAILIGDMSRTEIEYGLPWGWTPGRVTQAIYSPDTNVAVVRQSGSLVGFGIMRYEELMAHLQLLAVHESHRRKGIGTALLKWLEQVALTAGIENIEAEVRADNGAARSFYDANGYRKFGLVREMYHGSEDGVCLRKSLID